MSGVSSLAGIAAGIPFVILLWKIFQLFIVDTGEMKLVIHFQCLYVSAAFYLFGICLRLHYGLSIPEENKYP